MSKLNASSCNNRLKELMEEKEIKKEELAKKLSVSESTIKSYLNGHRPIPLDNIKRIAQEYAVSADWLLGLSEYRNSEDILVGSLLTLGRVFKVSTQETIERQDGEEYKWPATRLLIDKRFYDYLVDISEVRHSIGFVRTTFEAISEEDLRQMCSKILSKHKENLMKIFELDNFDEEQAVCVMSRDDIDFFDIL